MRTVLAMALVVAGIFWSCLSADAFALPLQQPGGVRALAGDGGVLCVWSPVSGAGETRYRIERATSPRGPWRFAATTDQTRVVDRVSAGKTLYYRVCAVGARHESGPYSRAVPATPIAPPAGLTVLGGRAGSVCSWPPVPEKLVTGYLVERSGSRAGEWSAAGRTSGTTFTDSRPNQRQSWYRVRAVVGGAVSGQTGATGQARKVAVPTGLTAVAGDGLTLCAWAPLPSSSAASYVVERSSSFLGPWTVVGRPVSETFEDRAPLPSHAYYRVRAVSPRGVEGSPCAPVAAAEIPVPDGLVASRGATEVACGWNAATGLAVTYRVETASAASGPFVGVRDTAETTFQDAIGGDAAVFFRVRTVLEGVAGRASVAVEASPVPVPSGVTVTAGDMRNSVSWSAAGSGVSAYVVERAQTAQGPWDRTATVAGTSIEDPIPVAGEWYYRVRAVGALGVQGAPSEAVANSLVRMSAEVASPGDVLQAANGRMTLTFPAGAFAAPTNVSVIEKAPEPDGGIIPITPRYEFLSLSPLLLPANVVVGYRVPDDRVLAAGTITRGADWMSLDESSGVWVPVPTTVDATAFTLSASMPHFSEWRGAMQPHGTSLTLVQSNSCNGVCHTTSTVNGRVVVSAGKDATVCYACHAGAAATDAHGVAVDGPNIKAEFMQYGGAYAFNPSAQSRHPLAAPGAATAVTLNCTSCHDPHKSPSDAPQLLRALDAVTGKPVASAGGVAAGNAFCWACHGTKSNGRVNLGVPNYWANSGGDKKTAYVVSPHRIVACEGCHEGHGASSSLNLVKGAGASACLACHSGAEAVGGVQIVAAHTIVSAGGTLPVDAALPCGDCHGPHGSLRGNASLLSDGLGGALDTSAGPAYVRRFCLTCHTTAEGLGWDSASATYSAPAAGARVEGLARSGGPAGSGPGGVGQNWLRLKTTTGHATGDTSMSCYDCHGGDYSSAEANNVHNPATYSASRHTAAAATATISIAGRSYGPYGCASCHALELAPEHAKPGSSSAAAGCSACHPDPRSSLSPSWNRTCTQAGCHTVASTAPMHGTIEGDHVLAPADLCWDSGCHGGATDLASLHSAATTTTGGTTLTSCGICHASGRTPSATCVSAGCHTTMHGDLTALHTGTDALDSVYATHGDWVTMYCSECHTMNMLPLHANYCGACHSVSARPAVKTAVANHQTGCVSCHPSQHNGSVDPHGDDYSCGPCHGDGCYCHGAWTPVPTPHTTSDALSYYVNDAVVHLSASDAVYGAFGIRETYHRLDSGALATGTAISIPAPASGSQEHTLTFWSVDWTGNTEAAHTATFTVAHDSFPPTTTTNAVGGKLYTGDTTFTLTPADAHSTVAGTWWQMDSTTGPWTAGTAPTVAGPSTGTTAHTLYFYSADSKGNTETVRSVAFDVTAGRTFAYTGGVQSLTVPAGVTGVYVIADGGSGGDDYYAPLYGVQYGVGGPGGRVSAVVTVTPGSTLTVYAGGAGGRAYPAGPAGWPNGAAGRNYGPGGGGGSSSLWAGATELLEAGGGGGAGYWYAPQNGGAGGAQGTLPGGFKTGTVGTYTYTGGGGGGWNNGFGGSAQYRGGTGGTSYIAVGNGTLTSGVNVGNGSVTIRWGQDWSAPTGSVAIADGAAWTRSTAVTLSLSAADFGGSGLSEMRLSANGVTWGSWEAVTPTRAWTLASGDGQKAVYVQFRDGAGNVSLSYSDAIGLDTQPPSTTSDVYPGRLYSDAQTFTLTPADAGGSGLAGTWWSLDTTAGPWTVGTSVPVPAPPVGTASHTLYWYSGDHAGNVETTRSVAFSIKPSGPGSNAVTSTVLADTAWRDVEVGASGPWGSYSVYVDDVLVGTKPVDFVTTWDFPGAAVSSGGHIDIVADCGFSSQAGTFDEHRPLTFTISLPAGSSLVDASTWSGFPDHLGVSYDLWYDDYGDYYDAVWLDPITLTNIKYTSGGSIYSLDYAPAAHGTVVGTTHQAVPWGGSGTTVTASPATGYHFADWSDGSTANPRADTNVTASKSVTADFAINSYTVTYTPGPNGTISGASPQTVTHEGSSTLVTAVADAGYHFLKWSDESTANPRRETTVTADMSFTAFFAVNVPHTVAYVAGANGSISGVCTQTVEWGGSTTPVTAVPDTGYTFANWSDGSTANPRTDTNVLYDLSLTANFTPQLFSIYSSAGTGGSISPLGWNNAVYGSSKTYTMTPSGGYRVACFMLDNDPVNGWRLPASSYTFADVTSGHYINAYFAASNTFTRIYPYAVHGWTSPYGPQFVVSGGAAPSMTAMPYSGYHFVNWSDGVTANPRLDTNVTTDAIVTPNFAPNSYTMTYTAGVNGTIAGASPQSVLYDSYGTTVTAVPNGGYRFVAWSDGVFTAARRDVCAGDRDVTASFAPAGLYNVIFYSDGEGYLSGTWAQSVAPGGSATPMTAYPYDSYRWEFSYWSDELGNVSYDNPLTVANVTRDQRWTVHYYNYYTGSCPFLFTWDGTGFGFESDLFSTSKLGALRSNGSYQKPNPNDYYVMENQPAPKDGQLEMRLVEERAETDYLDQMRLFAVDVPDGKDVKAVKIPQGGTYQPLGDVVHAVSAEPSSVPALHVQDGEDVSAEVAEADGHYVTLNPNKELPSFQTIELDLGHLSSAPAIKLILEGNSWMPETEEGKALAAAIPTASRQKVEVIANDGSWIALPGSWPKPAEFARPYLIDLTGMFPTDDYRVRLTFAFKTSVDSIQLDTTADEPLTVTEAPMSSAVLGHHGFDLHDVAGDIFKYVYGPPTLTGAYMPGLYTRFGDVTPLLSRIDDEFVVFGGGDEVTMRFDTPPPPARGKTRRWVVYANGYYKWANTDLPQTVDPLPFAAMSNYPYPSGESYPADADHEQYLTEWNTRREVLP